MAEKKEYRIKVQGQLVTVSEEVYVTYHRILMRRVAFIHGLSGGRTGLYFKSTKFYSNVVLPPKRSAVVE